LKQSLSLRVSQHLALTPQLQQSIRLLQLSTLELNQEIEQMLDENPFLEVSEEHPAHEEASPEHALASSSNSSSDEGDRSHSDGPDTADEPAAQEADTINDWEGDGSADYAAEDGDWGSDGPARNGSQNDDEVSAAELARSHESLQDYLHRQALSLRLNETGRQALYFLIESLNDDGYLEDSLEELARSLTGEQPDAEQLEELVEQFRIALKLLQSLEPTGVGAHHLAECLLLQLAQLPPSESSQVAQRICRQPIDLLARRDIKKLIQLCDASDSQIRAAINLIARLEPKPGRRFVEVERNIVVPDVIVTSSGSGPNIKFRAQLNPDVMPRLRVHDIYANALKGHKGDGGLQQRLQEARWFIKNIQQRFDTILRVSSAIVERQRNFFIHGELAMRPMVLREIADELGLHESTISRVTTAKYIATPYGTFELKYFFGSGLGTEAGGNASSTAVRALIKQFVASENPKKPLSDNQLSDMLREQGIECARRTVAKYREALKIAPANLRKAL
jgi:RNA polymerase sigma-54 factor